MVKKPKIWGREDIPTPPELAEYLGRIQAARDAFPGISGFPELPPDMDGFTFEEANRLEELLLQVHETVGRMKKGRIYSGELQTGGI